MPLVTRLCSNTFRLCVCLFLVFLFFLAELIVGHVCHSLALQADAFHMLSDSVSILLSLVAIRVEKKPPDSHNTFGWQRASVVGPLINSVMLQTFCFTIFMHAIERFISSHPIDDPQLMFYVGLGGLIVNIISIIILHGQPHGHSHGEVEVDSTSDAEILDAPPPVRLPVDNGEADTAVNRDSILLPTPSAPRTPERNHHGHSHGGRSMKGHRHDSILAVQLHMLADLLGSFIVISSALVIWLVPNSFGTGATSETNNTMLASNYSNLTSNNTLPTGTTETARWKLYLDPILSLVLVFIVSYNNVPFLMRLAQVLMQSVPNTVQVRQLKRQIREVEGVAHTHDLHVWQLRKNCSIGTVHLVCQSAGTNTTDVISQKVKSLFHHAGIHCTTIQVEQSGGETAIDENRNLCLCPCPNAECIVDECCNVTRHRNTSASATSTASHSAQQIRSSSQNNHQHQHYHHEHGDEMDVQAHSHSHHGHSHG